jgi:hypothetical protein
VINNLEELKTNVDENWKTCATIIEKKNIDLLQSDFENDSLRIYLKKAKHISLVECTDELEYNEYKINQFTMSENLLTSLESKTNAYLESYNNDVKRYNVSRTTFPNLLIARKTGFSKSFNYFDIRYGVENESKIKRRKKVGHWIKYGGPYPE